MTVRDTRSPPFGWSFGAGISWRPPERLRNVVVQYHDYSHCIRYKKNRKCGKHMPRVEQVNVFQKGTGYTLHPTFAGEGSRQRVPRAAGPPLKFLARPRNHSAFCLPPSGSGSRLQSPTPSSWASWRETLQAGRHPECDRCRTPKE